MLLHQEAGDGVDVLAVGGPVAAPDVRRLLHAVETSLARGPAVVVDLCDVTSLAPDAVGALRALADDSGLGGRPGLCWCGAPPSVEPALMGFAVHRTRAEAVAHVCEAGTGGRRVVPIEHSVHGPGQARRAAAECAARLGLRREQEQDLLLVVSEMVTNAVRYGAPPVQLELVVGDDAVLVAVSDSGPGRPRPRAADPDAEGGRGMMLVDQLSSDPGVRPQPPGKAVWAAVRRRPEACGS